MTGTVCAICHDRGLRWSESLEEMHDCFCQEERHDAAVQVSDDDAAGALNFAVGFLEGFEDDPDQAGVANSLRILRRARTLGYRLVRVR